MTINRSLYNVYSILRDGQWHSYADLYGSGKVGRTMAAHAIRQMLAVGLVENSCTHPAHFRLAATPRAGAITMRKRIESSSPVFHAKDL